MDAKRFDRLEQQVEKIDDKVDELKIDLTELRGDIRYYVDEVNRHVSGDEKIISEIIPFIHSFNSFLKNDMPQIKQVILAEEAKKIAEREVLIKKTNWKLNLSILTGILSIVYTLYKMDIIKF